MHLASVKLWASKASLPNQALVPSRNAGVYVTPPNHSQVTRITPKLASLCPNFNTAPTGRLWPWYPRGHGLETSVSFRA
ncbi:hypothetical protein TNCV_2895821 [Trichonephila clavipes]|nr:hypothetical protein TNCV_2895821 [Trichonephila clavipes]